MYSGKGANTALLFYVKQKAHTLYILLYLLKSYPAVDVLH